MISLSPINQHMQSLLRYWDYSAFVRQVICQNTALTCMSNVHVLFLGSWLFINSSYIVSLCVHWKQDIDTPLRMLVNSDVHMNFCKCRYAANKSMDGCAFCDADGDFLIVPQTGSKCSLNFFKCSALLEYGTVLFFFFL